MNLRWTIPMLAMAAYLFIGFGVWALKLEDLLVQTKLLAPSVGRGLLVILLGAVYLGLRWHDSRDHVEVFGGPANLPNQVLTVFAALRNRRIRCRLDHLGMNRAAESGYMASTYSILVHKDDLDRAIAIRDDVLRGSRKS